MANNYKKLDANFTQNWRNDLNANFDSVDKDIKSQKTRVDNLIQNAPQPSEVVDMRQDTSGVVHPTAKERIDTEFNKVMSDLAQIAVQVKASGTDDTQQLINAFQKAKQFGTSVYLPDSTYNVTSAISETIITSIIGRNTVINISGDVELHYDEDINIEGVKFVSDFSTDITVSPGTLITPLNDVSKVTLSKVAYISDVPLLDGSQRGKMFMRIKAKTIRIDDFSSENIRNSITIENTSTNDVESVIVDGFEVKNGQTGLYITGGNPNITSDEWINNVKINNISLINTQEQSNYYSQIAGSDLVMCERIRNLEINNIYSEYACERAAYLNVIEGLHVGEITLVNSEGVKVVGYVDKVAGVYNYTKDVDINVIVVRGGWDKKGLIAYEVKGLSIDGINVFNNPDSAHDVLILLERTIDDLMITNIKGKNVRRGMIHFNTVASTNYDNYFKNVTIDGINFLNPAIRTNAYTALRFTIDPTITSQYLFENLKINNVQVENQFVSDVDSGESLFVYSANANLKGLIDIDKVNGLTINDSSAVGIHDINGGVIVGSSSRKVNINCKLNVFNNDHVPTNMFTSANSEISVVRMDSSKFSNFTNTIIPVFQDYDSVIELLNNHTGEIKGNIVLNPDSEQALPFETTRSKSGILEVISDNGEYMTVNLTPTTLTKLSGTTNTIATNTAGYICAYLSNNRLIIRNRMGQTVRLYLVLKYINAS